MLGPIDALEQENCPTRPDDEIDRNQHHEGNLRPGQGAQRDKKEEQGIVSYDDRQKYQQPLSYFHHVASDGLTLEESHVPYHTVQM